MINGGPGLTAVATLFQGNWGYLPAVARLRISMVALRTLFEGAGLLENIRLSTPDRSASRRVPAVKERAELDQFLDYVEESVIGAPARHGSTLLAFGKLLVGDEHWVECRAEKLLLRVSAVDSLSRFLGRKSPDAARNMDAVLSLAAKLVEGSELKECIGYRGDAVTFFAGEPFLMYRPRLIERFFRDRHFDDAIEPFWRMYGALTESFPSDDVLELLRASSVEFRELRGGKVLARFGWCLDDLKIDGREVFRDVAAIVEDRVPGLVSLG